jgi:MSHA biogenesis protein MshL
MDISTKKIIKLIFIFFCTVIAIVSGCSVIKPKQDTAGDQIQCAIGQGIEMDCKRPHKKHEVPKSVSEALLPQINSHGSTDDTENQFSERRFDVAADHLPARTFFTGLVEGTNYNMVVSPKVDGTISLNLKNVTIEEAMDAVRDMYGYDYRHTSYGYEVSPPEMQTQIFNVNYLDVKRSGKSTTETESGQVDQVGTISVGGGGSGSNNGVPTTTVGSTSNEVSGTSVNTSSVSDFWASLDKTLKVMIPDDKGRSVIVNGQGGIVIAHAYPVELHRIARYLDSLQNNLQRQIIIEAKVLEVQLNNNFESGIDWSLFGNPLNGLATFSQQGNGPNSAGGSGSGAVSGNTNVNLPSFDPIFTVTVKGSFRTLVNFLQTQGNVQTLSSPRISTVNNQKAVIKVGQDQFFVTGVSTTNTLVGTNTLPSQNVNLTPFFSGVSLDVTPQINKNGTVILHIHPAVSVVTEQQQNIVLGTSNGTTPNTLTLPLALSTIRESDNIVRAHNGQVVVIGGLMQNTMTENVAGTPILSRLPFVGFLFRRTSQVATKSELVILLRPMIVDNRAWADDLEASNQRFHALKRDFHQGGLPDVFGNQGELTDNGYL